MRQWQTQRGAATAGPHREGAGGTEADDRHHGVLPAAATDGIAMPGDAVGTVTVATQPDGGEGLAEFAGVDVVEPPPQPREQRMRGIFDAEVVKTDQPGH